MFTIRHAATRAAAFAARRAPLTTTTMARQFSMTAPRAFSTTWIVRDQNRPLEPLEETTKPGVESGVTLESEEKLAQALEQPAAKTTEAEAKPAAEALEALESTQTPEQLAAKEAHTASIRAEKLTTLFVQNISWDVTEETIKEDFGAFGEITKVFRPGGRATWCMIIYKTAEEMQEAAKQVNETFWHGRRITAMPRRPDTVSEGRADRPRMGKNRKSDKAPTPYLFLGNLPYDITDAELTGLFDSVQGATGVRIATDPSTGMPRGYAHVDFRSIDDAQKAMEIFSQTTIKDRKLVVDYAERRAQHNRRSPVNKSRNADWTRNKHGGPQPGESS